MLPDIRTFKILKKRTCSVHISQTHSSQTSTTNSTCFSLFSHVDKLLYFSFGRTCCNYRNCSNSANIDIYLSKTLRDESKSSSLYSAHLRSLECAVILENYQIQNGLCRWYSHSGLSDCMEYINYCLSNLLGFIYSICRDLFSLTNPPAHVPSL